MNHKTLALNDYIYSLPFGMSDPARVDALYEVIQAWERGDSVFVKNSHGGEWIYPPVDPLPITQPAAVLPDWTCGCGAVLHGIEKSCWRCGAPKRP